MALDNGLNIPPLKSELPTNVETSQPWSGWFRSLYNNFGKPNNQTGTFTPTFTGFTPTGQCTITGNYYKIRDRVVFNITITPTTGTTASTLGASYCNNLPFTASSSSGFICINESSLASSNGMVKSGTKNAYLGTWVATNNSISCSGFYQTNE